MKTRQEGDGRIPCNLREFWAAETGSPSSGQQWAMEEWADRRFHPFIRPHQGQIEAEGKAQVQASMLSNETQQRARQDSSNREERAFVNVALLKCQVVPEYGLIGRGGQTLPSRTAAGQKIPPFCSLRIATDWPAGGRPNLGSGPAGPVAPSVQRCRCQ